VVEFAVFRFATGVAIASCFRQIGAVIGIAALVAILGTPHRGDVMTGFDRSWTMVAAAGLAAALIVLALGRVRAREVETLADPSASAELTFPSQSTSR
jgi:NTE family protein